MKKVFFALLGMTCFCYSAHSFLIQSGLSEEQFHRYCQEAAQKPEEFIRGISIPKPRQHTEITLEHMKDFLDSLLWNFEGIISEEQRDRSVLSQIETIGQDDIQQQDWVACFVMEGNGEYSLILKPEVKQI